MEKTCANHPESLALATCKACEKSVCLMCVQDEKEGTFCSSKCVQVFREVSDWVDTNPKGTAPVVVDEPEPPPPSEAAPSIFDSEPAPATAQAEFEPLVTPGSKWKMIGSVCGNHTDTPAVATCDRCDKTLCAMCLIETTAGTFCSNECANVQEPVPLPKAPAAPPRPPPPPPLHPASTRRRSSSKAPKVAALVGILAALGIGGYFVMNGLGSAGARISTPPQPPPILSRTDPVMPDPLKIDPVVKPDPTRDPKTDPKPDPVTDPKADPKTDPKTNPKTDPKSDPKPPVRPPPKPVKPEPPPVTRTDAPWLRETIGTWYRMRTTAGGQDAYLDCGLKAKDASRFVLSQQASRQGQAAAPQEVSLEPTSYFFKGEETLSIEGRSYLCEIREWNMGSGLLRSWVLLEGRHAGAVLKSASPGSTFLPRRVWEHTIKLGSRKFECLVVESDVESGGKHQPVKSWYCAQFPMGALRVESPDQATTLVDAGSDWSKRPPFPQ